MKGGRLFFLTGIFILMFFNEHEAFSQQSDCKVLIPALSGNYSGKCKNGLANGKGVAKGIDIYEGQFYKGLPQGKGKYTFANGSYYDGQWQEGKKDGKGKLVYMQTSIGDSIVEGFWKQDKYVGEKLIQPYIVKRNLGGVRYNFQKINNSNNNLAFKFLIGGRINSDIEALSFASDSGQEYTSGSIVGIQNFTIPAEVKITYRTWNQLHTSQSNVTFEFTINEPGKWEITINN